MKPEHLKIQTLNPYDTKGGQHAVAVPAGVCVTHIPTGLTATCFIERSQSRNRNVALAMIEYGLAELEWKDERKCKCGEPLTGPAEQCGACALNQLAR